jgi:hypothetical protein
MTDYQINEIAGDILLITILPLLVAWATYSFGAPWYRSALGVVTFVKWLALILVIGVILLRRFVGEYPGYGWVALIVYGLLFLAFSAMAVIVVLEVTYTSRTERKERAVSHVAVTKNTVPAIWFSAQRVIRTVLVNLVVILPVVNISLPLLVDAFTGEGVPVEVTVWVNAIVAGVLVVTGILTRVIAIPAVNAFLTKLGAGSVPKAAVENGLVAPTGGAPLVGR